MEFAPHFRDALEDAQTMAEISAISGHSAKSVQTIIDHYLGSTRELADAAIDKLIAWKKREGIAV